MLEHRFELPLSEHADNLHEGDDCLDYLEVQVKVALLELLLQTPPSAKKQIFEVITAFFEKVRAEWIHELLLRRSAQAIDMSTPQLLLGSGDEED